MYKPVLSTGVIWARMDLMKDIVKLHKNKGMTFEAYPMLETKHQDDKYIKIKESKMKHHVSRFLLFIFHLLYKCLDKLLLF